MSEFPYWVSLSLPHAKAPTKTLTTDTTTATPPTSLPRISRSVERASSDMVRSASGHPFPMRCGFASERIGAQLLCEPQAIQSATVARSVDETVGPFWGISSPQPVPDRTQ